MATLGKSNENHEPDFSVFLYGAVTGLQQNTVQGREEAAANPR